MQEWLNHVTDYVLDLFYQKITRKQRYCKNLQELSNHLSVIVREKHAKLQKPQRKGSAELLRTNIIDILGGLMHKYA